MILNGLLIVLLASQDSGSYQTVTVADTLHQDEKSDPFKGLWKPVDLDLRNVDARQALDSIFQKSNQNFDSRIYIPEKKISIKLQNCTFWQALDEVCRLHGGIRHLSRPLHMYESAVRENQWVEYPAWYRGPLAIYIYDSARVREFEYPERLDRTELTLVVKWAKGFTPALDEHLVPGTLRITRAQDSAGKSLLPEVSIENINIHTPSGNIPGEAHAWILRLQPTGLGTTLALLNGEWEVTFLSDITSATFENPTECVGQEKKVGPYTITLAAFVKTGKPLDRDSSYNCTFRISYDQKTASEEFKRSLKTFPLCRRVLPMGRLVTEDAGGESNPFVVSEQKAGKDQDKESAVMEGWIHGTGLRGASPPSAITIQVSNGISTVRVPFFFKEVRLPKSEP